MYSLVLMVAMNGSAAVPVDRLADESRYGDHLQHEQYRHRHGCGGGHGGCHGGGYGGCSGGYGGGYGGCSGGYGGGYGGCSGGYGGCHGGYGGGYGCSGGYGSYGSYGQGNRYGYAGSSVPYYGLNGMNADGAYYGGAVPTPGYYEGEIRGDERKDGRRERRDNRNENRNENRDNRESLAPGTAPATIIVHVPEDARLTFDGQATSSTSVERRFVTPALEDGQTFYYTVVAEVSRDGRTVKKSQEIAVRSGQETHVSLDPASAGVARK